MKVMNDIVRYTVLMPVFFIGFCLIYNPFGIQQYLSDMPMGAFVSTLMLGCITAVVTALGRTAMKVMKKRYTFNSWHNFLWSFGEMMADAAFFALYISLLKGIDYSEALAASAKFSVFCLIFPYAARAMTFKEDIPVEDKLLIKFRDEHGNLKLSIKPENLLFITAETNYIKIYYQESGRTRDFLVRASMKSQEENVLAYGLVRCHRSYIVNPRHVAALRKEKDGPICAVLDSASELNIPVSKQYYDTLSALL